MKLLEWNLNGRTKGNSDLAVELIGDSVARISPDGLVFTEYIRNQYLTSLLQEQGFVISEDNAGQPNGVLLAVKKDCFEITREIDLVPSESNPNFHLIQVKNRKDASQNFTLAGVRIQVGREHGEADYNNDFKRRMEQLAVLILELKGSDVGSLFAMGDFNNAPYKDSDSVDSYAGRARQFYSYPLLRQELNDHDLALITPLDASSCGALRLDHLVSSYRDQVKKIIYDWSFTGDRRYRKNVVGFPDHAMLIADVSTNPVKPKALEGALL
ncbi:endonuclease/exonuclease/phosphatase [Oenococcus kitaharae]|uniref:Endonuclease/exonuclease/phosphatase family protein n=1 Tax=Oenococcus kitaharae DSM 17330 TaxID=1045004 RepID=G9WJW0_9LACO|nr:endonuclease/exonuclease/phosphatase [Oenococcus kitaharae]EHN58128.1 endonuclease/exonuclease/phosphatase family protein [Oenococcus kitaharae DSM 17330]OEY82412.1 hypothetical protein NV75_08380 [Oenococcus kitaharae]OEY82550.1 hypothetical protein NT95_06160 [Oenococcus kitaharae]OEY84201.1 hypothetical protein NT96_05305 [Oenococcus kitaharae]